MLQERVTFHHHIDGLGIAHDMQVRLGKFGKALTCLDMLNIGIADFPFLWDLPVERLFAGCEALY